MSVIEQMLARAAARPHTWGDVVGQSITGTVLRIRERQLEEFERPGVMETWPDGTPRMTPIITLQTEEDAGLDDEGNPDDGTRDLYVRQNLYKALFKAISAAPKSCQSDEGMVGVTLHAELTGRSKSSIKGGTDRKLFTVRLSNFPSDTV